MTHTLQMIETYPQGVSMNTSVLGKCVDACLDTVQACTACADACLSEQMVADLIKCIRTNLDCADLCGTTARILSRQTGYDAGLTRTTVQACMQACRMCAQECERHAQEFAHCQICADACRRSEQACQEFLSAMG